MHAGAVVGKFRHGLGILCFEGRVTRSLASRLPTRETRGKASQHARPTGRFGSMASGSRKGPEDTAPPTCTLGRLALPGRGFFSAWSVVATRVLNFQFLPFAHRTGSAPF